MSSCASSEILIPRKLVHFSAWLMFWSVAALTTAQANFTLTAAVVKIFGEHDSSEHPTTLTSTQQNVILSDFYSECITQSLRGRTERASHNCPESMSSWLRTVEV